MAQYGFYFDGTRCTGCKTCVLACKDYNDLTEEVSFRNIIEYGGGEWKQDSNGCWTTDTYAYHISIACNHCDNPACMANCPVDAYTKDEETGYVWSDHDICIGCGTCVKSCPYGAPAVDATLKKSVKCTMCYERVVDGKKPICVEGCSLRALDFGEIGELRKKYGEDAELAPLPAASETMPNIVFKLPANAKPVGDKTGTTLNTIDLVLGE